MVIDCGGGVVENPANMRLLRENSVVVWVDASMEDIITRLASDENAHRPQLSSGLTWEDDTRTNYDRRKPMYEQWSGFYVNTSQQEMTEIVAEIVAVSR